MQVISVCNIVSSIKFHYWTSVDIGVTIWSPKAPKSLAASVYFVKLRFSHQFAFSPPFYPCKYFWWVCGLSLISQCELHFEFNYSLFSWDQDCIYNFLFDWSSHLGQRLNGAAVQPCFVLYQNFLKRSYKYSSWQFSLEKLEKHWCLWGKEQSVIDYAIELAGYSGWVQPLLIEAFLNSLSETLKEHLAPLELPVNLEPLINLE